MGFIMEGRGRGMSLGTIRLEVGIWGMDRIRSILRVVVVAGVGTGAGTASERRRRESILCLGWSLGDGSCACGCL